MSKNIQMNYLNSDGSYEELYPENGCLPLTGGSMNGPINFYSNEIGANATINGTSLGLNITNQYNTGEIRFISKPQSSSDNTVVNLKIGGTPLITSGTNGVPEFVNINAQSVFNARSIIKQVANPVDAQDAVTKNYVDSFVESRIVSIETTLTPGSVIDVQFSFSPSIFFFCNIGNMALFGFGTNGRIVRSRIQSPIVYVQNYDNISGGIRFYTQTEFIITNELFVFTGIK